MGTIPYLHPQVDRAPLLPISPLSIYRNNEALYAKNTLVSKVKVVLG